MLAGITVKDDFAVMDSYEENEVVCWDIEKLKPGHSWPHVRLQMCSQFVNVI